MKQESQEIVIDKNRSTKRLVNSFKYAFSGIVYGYKNEQNMLVHILAAICVIVLGFIFKIDAYEWLFVISAIGLVIAAELINTAIEATIDIVCKTYNIEAKIAKDTAAACVLVLATTALAGGIFIFLPKIIALF